VLAPAFYALGDARTPMLVSLLSILVNLTLNWTLVHLLGLGHVGLALSTSAVALGNCALLYVFLRRRIGPLGGGIAGTLGRILLAAAVMAAAGAAMDAALASRLPASGAARYALALAIQTPACVAVFLGAARVLGVPVPVPGFRRRASGSH
jgi:putative peptidoglycan lipid II flippase